MLEEFIASTNSNVFLREFSFSENTFRPSPGEEVEFADHVIWVDDLLMLYQLKERAKLTGMSPEGERRWFRKKVLKEATKQVRDTLRYLETQPEISITNQRGHRINVGGSAPSRTVKVVVYAASEMLPDDCLRVRHHWSASGGFMHVISQTDYLGICRMLITPGEIAEYLGFREALIDRWTEHTRIPPEPALVGQFLESDDPTRKPRRAYYRNLYSLREDPSEFDLSFILKPFAERIEYTSAAEGLPEIFGSDQHYYFLLAEFAKLNRTELREVKERILLSLNVARRDEFEPPYRVTSPNTGCGFLFIPMSRDMIPSRSIGHQNLAYASKYEQQLERQVSASFAFDGEDYLIEWMYLDAPWQHDPEIEARLKEAYPFRPLREHDANRYNLEGA